MCKENDQPKTQEEQWAAINYGGLGVAIVRKEQMEDSSSDQKVAKDQPQTTK